MPKNNIDYQKTIIYGIFSNDPSLGYCYIGHTTDITRRRSDHKTRSNSVNEKDKKYNYPLYTTIRNNGGWLGFTMRVIEIFPCVSRLEASARENHFFHFYKATMNGQVPNQTRKESNAIYYGNNKDELKIKRHDNRDEYLNYQKKYNEINKDMIKLKKQSYYQRKKLEKIEMNLKN